MIKKFKKVTDKLYRGGCPSPSDLDHLKSKYNIERVVSLDDKSSKKIERSCKLLNLDHITIPLDGTRASLLKFLTHDLKDLLSSKNTFVHCSAGKDRTGLACALFKIKNLNMPRRKAFEEACQIGFGIDLDPIASKIYRECILGKDDVNDADIVDNERQNVGDSKDSYLEEATQHSFPPLDGTRIDPTDPVYQDHYNQSGTRQDYGQPITKHEERNRIPLVGLYNNDAGLTGAGPTQNIGGFIYD